MLNKMKTKYAKSWLDKATEANNAAEILNNVGRIEEAKRLLLVAKYCYRRYQNTMQTEALRSHGSRLQDTILLYVGLIVSFILAAGFIYCLYKAKF
jgi:hypothetical protein